MGALCEIFVAAATAENAEVEDAGVAGLAAAAFQVLARWIDDGLLVAAADATPHLPST